MSVKPPILVAFDGTESAHDVLDEAVELARRLGTRLVLLRTVTVAPVYAPSALHVTASQVTHSQDTAQRELRALTDHIPNKLLAGASVQLGTPWEAICQVAHEKAAELIVIGFGPTSTRVVKHAPCPVMVVRERVPSAA